MDRKRYRLTDDPSMYPGDARVLRIKDLRQLHRVTCEKLRAAEVVVIGGKLWKNRFGPIYS